MEAPTPIPAATASSSTPSEVERETPAQAKAPASLSEVPVVAEPAVASSGATPVMPTDAVGQPDLAVTAVPAPSIAAAASVPPPADHAAPRPPVASRKGTSRAKRDTRKRRMPSRPGRGTGRSAPAAPKPSSHSVAPSVELPNRAGPVQDVGNATARLHEVLFETVPTAHQTAALGLGNDVEPVPAPSPARDLSRLEKRDARPSTPLDDSRERRERWLVEQPRRK